MKPQKIDFSKVKEILNSNATQEWFKGNLYDWDYNYDSERAGNNEYFTRRFKPNKGDSSSRTELLGSCVSADGKALMVMGFYIYTGHPGKVEGNIKSRAVVGLRIIHGNDTYEYGIEDTVNPSKPENSRNLMDIKDHILLVENFISKRTSPQTGSIDLPIGYLYKGLDANVLKNPRGLVPQPL